MKLFLLHTVLLNKLPLKYRAQTINSSFLDDFYKAKAGNVYPFHEVSEYMKQKSAFRAPWLATNTRKIPHYSPPPCWIIAKRASDVTTQTNKLQDSDK